MRNKYSYIGAGLLCVAALTSCSNEEIISEKINAGLTEYTVTADANFDKEAAGQGTRANVKEDGKSFIWNKGDKLTLWNGTQGYTFRAVDSYDESVYYSKVEFKGEASFEEGQEIWGIYPCKESPSADNVFTFTLPQPQVQEGTVPALQNSMCMYAKGTVSGNTVSNMVFQHLTGTLHFTLVNKRGYDIQLEKIVVSADSPVFPLSATLNADGTVSYTDETEQFELDLHNQTISNTESFSAYASVFPTDKMTGDTKLTISIKVAGTEELEVIKEGTVKSLYGEDTSFAKDGYKYVAGKRYGISKTLLPLEGDLGYIENGDTYSVYATNGLIAVLSDAQIAGNSDKTILLTQSIDMQGESLTPVENFAATLDGNGNFISNYTISNSGSQGDYALFINNSGIIKNLVIKDITLSNAKVATSNKNVSSFVGVNTGSIIGCTFDNIQLTLPATSSKARLGVVTGTNSGDITDVNVLNSQINVNQWCDAGAISGVNTKNITNCYADATVSLDNPDPDKGAANFGGIVGWANGGNIYASGTHLTLTIIKGAKVGGVVGANGGNIELTYSTGSITGGSSKAGFICTAAQNNKVKKSYTTIADLKFCNEYAGTFENCYTSSAASETQPGITTTTVDQIKEGLKDQSVTIGEATYKFAENTGSDSSTRPLIIEKQ